MSPEVQAAVERELARVMASENACEGETASWADRARAHDQDRRTILSALAEANERASLLQTAVHERCAERDEAREVVATKDDLIKSHERIAEQLRSDCAWAEMKRQENLDRARTAEATLNPQQEGSR